MTISSAHESARRCSPRVEALEDRCQPSRGVDVILEWNAVALEANRVDHTPSLGGQYEQRGPTATARAMAIVHAAMYDAYNSVKRVGEAYQVSPTARMTRNANADAAVASAAFRTLSALFPSQTTTFAQALRRTLARVPNGAAENRGVTLGNFVGNRYLLLRQNDGSENAGPYVPEGTGTGFFQTFAGEPAALDPNWGEVTPFGLTSGDQFQADAPPALDSQEYADAYNEVWVKGAADAETADRDGDGQPDRTAEETIIGIYWGYDGVPGLGTPPRLYNQIARTIAAQEGNTEAENARMFALVNLAMADAGIASWETKYTYDVWRPNRGIQQVGPNGESLDDGNPDTQAEADWQPLGAPATYPGANFTPPFPAYTSGHATFGAALFETLRQFYGTDDISFTFTSDEYNGVTVGADGQVRPKVTRTFDSLSEAEYENAQSRIYLGVHWGFDRDAGIEQGRAVADYIFDNFLEARSTTPRGGSPGSRGASADNDVGAAPAAPRRILGISRDQTLVAALAEVEESSRESTPTAGAPPGAAAQSLALNALFSAGGFVVRMGKVV